MRYAAVSHASMFHPNGSFAVDTGVTVPRFDVGPEALEFLRREGYVVIRNANTSEVAHARTLLWSFLEGTGTGVRRDDPATWINSRPNPYGIGAHMPSPKRLI